MPALIRNKAIIKDSWRFPAVEVVDGSDSDRVCTLSAWLNAGGPDTVGAVQLQPGDDCTALADGLPALRLVAVYFTAFTDGRGFSLARELRDLGFRGELRARGHILPDQVQYLYRCGYDAFQPDDESRLQPSLARIQGFSNHYQASIDQPLPLFRRRA